jgi:hypothetical protein
MVRGRCPRISSFAAGTGCDEAGVELERLLRALN